jgi:hypothetical protein
MYFIVMFMYTYCSATLTEVFPFFSSVVKQMAGYNSQRRGTARMFMLFYVLFIFVLFCVLFVLCPSVYCLCVNVHCTAATGWQPNCS